MIYFIQSGKNGPIKIGYTTDNPKGRIRSLQVGNHKQLYLLATRKGELNDERKIHRMFRRDKLRGEWFESSHDLKTFIRNEGKILNFRESYDLDSEYDNTPTMEERIRVMYPEYRSPPQVYRT